VQRFAVHFAEYGHGLDAQFAARAENPHGNLTAIGNQDFFEHKKWSEEKV